MTEANPPELIPCPYHVACQGYMDPVNPTQDNLCPECFEAICESHEEAELAEYEEQMRAEARGEMFVPRWENLPSTKRAEAALPVTLATDPTE